MAAFLLGFCDSFLRRQVPMKASSRLLTFCKYCKSSPLFTSTVHPFTAHLSQKLSQVDKRTSEIGFPDQFSPVPSVPKKPTSQTRFFDEPNSQTRFFDEPFSGTGDFEASSSQTRFLEKPIAEAGFSEEPTSETGIPVRPISKTGSLEDAASEAEISGDPNSQNRFFDEPIPGTGDFEASPSQTSFFEKPISETGFSEEPNSETGIPNKPISKIGSLEDAASETEISAEPNSQNRYPDKPTSQNPEEIASCSSDSFLTQDSVIEFLLENRHDPNAALKFFHWAERRRGVVRGIDAMCIMLHILVRSRRISSAQKLLNQSFSGSSIPSAGIFIERLIESSKRCDSHPCLFDYVINSYLQAGRIEEAVESFERLVENNIFPGVTSRNILLAALVRLNLTGKARKLYQEMQHKGMDCDCFTLDVVMNACLKEGKPEEAEEYFREMKSRGFKLDLITYTTMIRAVCEKTDSKKACELLEEMKGLGWNPSKVTYTIVIEACMKQGNLQEALRLKGEALRLKAEVLSNGRLNFGGYN